MRIVPHTISISPIFPTSRKVYHLYVQRYLNSSWSPIDIRTELAEMSSLYSNIICGYVGNSQFQTIAHYSISFAHVLILNTDRINLHDTTNIIRRLWLNLLQSQVVDEYHPMPYIDGTLPFSSRTNKCQQPSYYQSNG